ncbi:MAG: PAS domain-containing protein, partial [Bacteroidia bacterium]|nr:PAS domain-containing protein [Bacteroidia bacterium]
MSKTKYIILFFLLLIFKISGLVYAQGEQFKHYGVEDGLVQANSSTITQDKNGNLWIGTWAGISKFNGKEFIPYTIQDGLASQFISTSLADEQFVWFGHKDGGLSKYDIEKNVFVEVNIKYATQYNEVTSIIKDDNNNLWIGTQGGGIVIITKSSSKVIVITTEEGLCNNNIYSLTKDINGNIWCGTEFGISLINTKKLFAYFENPNTDKKVSKKEIISNLSSGNGILSGKVTSLLISNETELWIGTMENGLIICDLQYYLQNGDQLSEKHFIIREVKYQLNKTNGFPSNNITRIIIDNESMIWVSTIDKGIIKINPQHYTQTSPTEDNFVAIRAYGIAEGLSMNNIHALFCDRENNLWAGSWVGIDMLQGDRFVTYDTKDGLSGINISSIYEDQSKNIWIGTFSGLNIMSPDKMNSKFSTNTLFTTLRKKLDNTMILDIAEDKNENMWFGTNIGLYKFNKRENTIAFLDKDDGLPTNKVNSLEVDNSILWIGTDKGICKLDINKLTVNSISLSSKLDTAYVDDILMDSKSRLWIGFIGNGLAVYDGNTVQQYNDKDGIHSKLIRGILEDLNGNIWIASLDKGVYRYAEGKFTSYGKKDGMQSETTYLINCDNNNNIWVGTNLGVEKISANTGLITSYGKLEGFKGFECNMNATCVDHLGNVWFGTVFGAIKYNPLADYQNELEPKTKITSLQVFNEENEFSKDGIFEHDKNYLTFKYIGVSLTIPKKVRYQYQLAGFDRNWSPEIDKTEVTYSFLPPGEYTFNVKACNNDGVWNQEPASYSFTILTPFWTTWWFLNLCIIAVFGGFFSIYKYRLQSLRRTRSRLEETVKERTQELNEQKDELEKLSIVASNTLNSVVILNELGEFEWANKAFENITEYSLDAFIEAYGKNILDLHEDAKLKTKIAKAIEKKQPLVYDAINISKSGKENWMQTNLTPIVENGNLKKIVVIDTDISEMKKAESDIKLKNKEIEEKNKKLWKTSLAVNKEKEEVEKIKLELEEKNKHITDSINYAQNIQEALLPTPEELTKSFKDHFVLFKPKDIVSGDFYWHGIVETEEKEHHFIAAVDCTGHGVPGAFMSMIGH